MFRLTPNAEIVGTSVEDYISISPAKLKQLFGEPERGDGYKMSGIYVFQDWEDNMITLYDWKCTDLYDQGHPSPEDFWNDTKDAYFHVGSIKKETARRFVNILQEICNLKG